MVKNNKKSTENKYVAEKTRELWPSQPKRVEESSKARKPTALTADK